MVAFHELLCELSLKGAGGLHFFHDRKLFLIWKILIIKDNNDVFPQSKHQFILLLSFPNDIFLLFPGGNFPLSNTHFHHTKAIRLKKDVPKKSCCSFGFCPNYLPPSPQFGHLVPLIFNIKNVDLF